jgi:type I restriction enzyme S subunit
MFYEQKLKLVHGTKVMEVTPDSLNNIIVPVPSMDEQIAIANTLDDLTDKTNEFVNALKEETYMTIKRYNYYKNLLLKTGSNKE